jgi:branched-chain amino acid transport system substrate-binding protein
MTRPTRRLITRRAIVAAAPAAAALASFGARAQAKPDFHIGAVSSLTGPAAPFGKDYNDGFVAYVKAWNERGGHDGRKIVLTALDDETNPVNAVNAFRKVATDAKTSVIWMALGSQTALGIKAIASEFKVPVVSGGGVDELGRPPDPWFFKIAPGASDFVKGMIEWAKAKGVKSMATLNDAGAFGQAEQKAVREMTEKAGIKLVAAESFALADTNFNAQLVKIRNAKPDLFYNGATGSPAILIFKQIKQLQIEIPMVVSLAAITGAFFQGIGGREQAEGILCIIPHGALAADIGGAAAEQHKAASAALGKPALLFHTLGWDTGTITEAAMKKSDLSRAGIRDQIEMLKDLPTINGPVTYTKTDHIGHDTRGLVLARYKGGKWVPEK